MYFNIAGLNLAILHPILPILPEENANYRQFISFAKKAVHVDHICHIDSDKLTLSNELQKVETFLENTWLLYKNKKSSEYFILPKNPRTKSQEWILKFDSAFANTVIYCNESYHLKSQGREYIANIFHRPLDQIFLIHYLLKNEGAIIHASGVDIDNKGFIFPGVSGAGKSTLTKLFIRDNIGSWLSDERMVIKRDKYGFDIYGTPWPSKANIALNKAASLKAIVFIAHGREPTIKSLTAKETLAKLLEVTSIPWYDANFTELAFNFLNQLISNIPAYEFSYAPSQKVLHVFQKFVAINF